MPKQVRKPCSGWGREARTASASLAVAGPAFRAHDTMRAGVQEACRRWASGMWAGSVV
jgi:hypothetical protein